MIVGLTGGIGSGKTSVLQLFINKGVPVYIADLEAKKLMQTNPELIRKIKDTFGNKSYIKGELNRTYLAKQVFGNTEKLDKLNAIVHPAVHKDFKKFIKEQNANYLIFENAILFENGSDVFCDVLITVLAPIDIRIQRVVARDKVTPRQVKDRMQHQWDDELKAKKSDFIIENIEWDTTKEVVCEMHEKLEMMSMKYKA